MPRCVICDTSFCYASWSGPAEPCDCGSEITRETAREMDPAELKRLERRWASPDEAEFNPDGTLKVEA